MYLGEYKMTKKFNVIFDNGGGVTLQVGKRGFVHNYDNPKQAAEDVKVLLETSDTSDWEGNEPECRMDYDFEMERNGGYRWHNQDDVKTILKDKVLGYNRNFGYNMSEFYSVLGVEIEE
jgi:hypothetical protein